MKRFVVALSFLTRLPLPSVAATAEDFAAAIRWYPAVGLVIGALLLLAAMAGAVVADTWTGALAVLAAWVLVTGALHLDGLGDVADGMGAAHGDPRRLLAVMADPHIGSFGVTAIALQLLAKLVLLHALLAGPPWPLLLVPFVARCGPLVWAKLLPPLGDGLGAAVARTVRGRDLAIAAGLIGLAAIAIPALLVAAPLIGGWAWWLRRRLGGVNGDAHGAGIELVETGLLVALVLARQL